VLRAIFLAGFLAYAALADQVVEGHIVNSVTGVGVPAVRVRICPVPRVPAGDYSATTDAQGRFRIEGVKEGEYTASYEAPDFVPVPTPGNVLPPFQVAGGSEPVSLELKLHPEGKLSGRVLDATGKPIPNASLWLVRGDRSCKLPSCLPLYLYGQSKTNEKGEYALDHVLPGPWLLSATAPPSWDPPESRGDERLGWTQTFYPGVSDPQLAEIVMVRPGDEVRSPDIKLATSPVHRVRGRVLDVRGDPVPKASVALGKGFGPRLTQEAKADGTFEFPAVVDDEWRLSAAVDNGGIKLRAAKSVEIEGRDLDQVEVRLTAPFSLRGKIVMEVPEGVPAPQLPTLDLELAFVAALPSDAGDAFIHTFIQVRSDQGGLTVRNVYPGSYEIYPILDSPAAYFLDSIRLGDRDARGSVSILSDAQPLIVTYKFGGGTVRGTIDACADGHAFLIPQDPALRRIGFLRVTQCGRNGRFEFPAVRPEEYYGLAVAGDFDPFGGLGPFAAILSDTAVLKQASSVTVRANESTSAEIPLISR
jgi:hypothetical protein